MGSTSGWGISEQIARMYREAQVVDKWEESVVNENERRRREAAKAHAQQQQAKADMLKKTIGEQLTQNIITTRNSGSFTYDNARIAGISQNSWGKQWQTEVSNNIFGQVPVQRGNSEPLTKEAIDKAIKTMKESGLDMEEAARRLNSLTGLYKDNGHKKKCQFDYERAGDHPCSCQPPTLWERVLIWYCDCCQRAAAPMRYGLCDDCRGHEYAPMEQVRVDHEVIDE